MIVYVSDRFLGKVDVVPDCCYVATEFVCGWFIPVLPRRSMLFFEDPSMPGVEVGLPVRFSLKSILTAYLRMMLVFGIFIGATRLVVAFLTIFRITRLITDDLPKAILLRFVFLTAMCLFWYVSRRLSLASYNRRERLSKIPELPPEIVKKLLESRDWLNADEADAS